jgi:hypothetical protein
MLSFREKAYGEIIHHNLNIFINKFGLVLVMVSQIFNILQYEVDVTLNGKLYA